MQALSLHDTVASTVRKPAINVPYEFSIRHFFQGLLMSNPDFNECIKLARLCLHQSEGVGGNFRAQSQRLLAAGNSTAIDEGAVSTEEIESPNDSISFTMHDDDAAPNQGCKGRSWLGAALGWMLRCIPLSCGDLVGHDV